MRGELDLQSVARLHAIAEAVLATYPDRDLTIDLSGLTFCDSSGLSEFVRLDHQLQRRGRQLRLRQATPAVLHVLNLTHLDTALDID